MHFRRLRFITRVAQELARQYTFALFFGFIFGIVGSITLLRIGPILLARWFFPTERIGVVGEFSPTTVPLSIRSKLSFGLVALEEDGQVTTGLASAWEIADEGRLYKFSLQSGLKWHDGKPVLASDVNYNIKNVEFVSSGPNTLAAKLTTGYSPFLTLLSKPILKAGLVGFGPYRVDGIVLSGGIVRYLKLIPVTKDTKHTIEYRFYRTEKQAITAYKLGEVDRIEDIQNPEELASWGKTRIEEKTRYDRIVTLFFNLKDPILSDKNARHALAYSTPDFSSEHAFSPMVKTSWAYTENVRRYTLQPDQVKKLLKSSPLASESAELTITTFSPYVDDAQKIAESWKSNGIRAKIVVENSLPSDYQVLLSAQNVPPDPDQYPFWHSTQLSGNITSYTNVKVDKLLEDGRKELDIDKRKKIYSDFQRRLVEDAPAVFLYYPKTYSIERGR